jgi:hypothetical protein
MKKVIFKYLITPFAWLTVSFIPAAQAELLWTPRPLENNEHGHQTSMQNQLGHENHGGRPREKAFYLQDGKGADVRFVLPDLSETQLEMVGNNGKYVIPKTGVDNYHALIATRQSEKQHESSLRYLYMRGKPSGESPNKLVNKHKLPLEIVPDPMVREHWRFYSQNTHRFKLLFNQKLLPETWALLKTSNGSTIELMSDKEGYVNITLPDDFSEVKPGRRANKPAEFMLRTAHVLDDKTYITNFTSAYSVNPSHWNSNLGGVITLSLGFLSGIVIMRKHNQKNSIQKNNKKRQGVV